MTDSEKLKAMGACQKAVDFVEGKTIKQAWEECKMVDWLFWLHYRMINVVGWPNEQEILGALYLAIAPFVYAFSDSEHAITAIESVATCAHDLTEENHAASRRASWASLAASQASLAASQASLAASQTSLAASQASLAASQASLAALLAAGIENEADEFILETIKENLYVGKLPEQFDSLAECESNLTQKESCK